MRVKGKKLLIKVLHENIKETCDEIITCVFSSNFPKYPVTSPNQRVQPKQENQNVLFSAIKSQILNKTSM